MRKLLIVPSAMVAFAVLGAEPSFARVEGPWCLHTSLGRDAFIGKCDLPSYEACRAERGNLGSTYCTQNPYY
jgi:hypothetical protein